MNEQSYLFKFVLVGDSGVGKSCLMNQYVFGKFRDEHEPTIGVEFESKLVELNDNIRIQIQTWDTSGDQQFKAITRSFFKYPAAGIFVYDTTNRGSFESIEKWYEEFTSLASDIVQCVIVGTKIDYEQQRQVTTEEGQMLADKIKCKFYEVNCHCTDSIEAIYNTLSYEVLKLVQSGKIDIDNESYGVKSLTEGRKIDANYKPEMKPKQSFQIQKQYLVLPVVILVGTLLRYLMS